MKITIIIIIVITSLYLASCKLNTNDEGTIDIAAFNVRIFGTSKIVDVDVMEHLVDIILRYDLIVIQEVRDTSGMAIKHLFNHLVKDAMKIYNSNVYKMILSPRLGRTSSKEEYAFIYRSDILTLTSSYTYSDPNDAFEREPFIARFNCKISSIQDFAVAAIHTSPRDAQNEISNLTRVYDDVVKTWNIHDVIIMGDFNAGNSYVRDWKQISLATDQRFYWLIDDSKDTTTERTDFAYDRMVVAGQKLIEAVLPQGSNVFLYDEEFGLNETQTRAVSDHYPVEMKLRLTAEKEDTYFKESINILDNRVYKFLYKNARNVYSMRKTAISRRKYTVFEKYTKTGAYLEITVSRITSVYLDALKNLNELQAEFPDFVSMSQIYIARRFVKKMTARPYLPRGGNRYRTLYDYYKQRKTEYTIQLICSLQSRSNPICLLHINSFMK